VIAVVAVAFCEDCAFNAGLDVGFHVVIDHGGGRRKDRAAKKAALLIIHLKMWLEGELVGKCCILWIVDPGLEKALSFLVTFA
jgi:hypothetical protein